MLVSAGRPEGKVRGELNPEGVRLEAGSSDDRRLHRPAWGIVRAASDWSIVIISTLPNSLTGSRGEYFRVVGIYSDG